MDLKSLVEPHLDLARLSKDLDDLGPFGRSWSVGQWTRRQMAALWEASAGFRPLSLADLVPSSTAAFSSVAHYGKNSLPLFSYFEKRFCRPNRPEEDAILYGYNVQALSSLTGPGYFVASAGPGHGEVILDHRRTPDAKARDWPALQPSGSGLGRLVFGGVVDVLRGLSSHVTVGRVRRDDGWLDAWFVLVRQP